MKNKHRRNPATKSAGSAFRLQGFGFLSQPERALALQLAGQLGPALEARVITPADAQELILGRLRDHRAARRFFAAA
ncbi:MAG: hypothetical protein KKA73_24550 [Chloroflexi bacterium]|nr:hypothetical protein [Chloroflexota bacterium]MBU1750865.1 hypothetical protein [Chloroflexota bacterium]